MASLFKEEKHNPNSKKPLVMFCHIMFKDFCIFGMDVNLLTKQIIWSKDSLNMDFYNTKRMPVVGHSWGIRLENSSDIKRNSRDILSAWAIYQLSLEEYFL